ncbi:MAG: amidohydrolase family protein [Lentisphaeria bacterium]|nr:amidohydrolase family protein [Lentisphaeria bacterium]
MKIYGNVVAPENAGYGFVEYENGKITAVEIVEDVRSEADWILPGFIDVHLHGMFDGEASAEKVHLMAQHEPSTGVVRFCPASASEPHENISAFIRRVRELVENPMPGCALIHGSHLEGPFLEYVHRGGMNENYIRKPDPEETAEWLEEGGGTVKIMTIAPELPDADKVIAKLIENGVIASAGHSAMNIEELQHFVEIGGRGICHLYDAHDGREVYNCVVQPSAADAILMDDRLFVELILDGVHVPEMLVRLSIRTAGAKRIIGITDSLLGAGDPYGEYPMLDAGRSFHFKDGVFRLVEDDDVIVGSALTMNVVFYNLCNKFGCNPVESAWMTSGNAARYLGIDSFTGSLQKGLNADIAVLGSDMLTVKKTILNGDVIYGN